MSLDALTQGAVAGLGSHPPGEINTANCVLWLEPSLLPARLAIAFRLYTRLCRGMCDAAESQLPFPSKHLLALWQEQKVWQYFFTLTKQGCCRCHREDQC